VILGLLNDTSATASSGRMIMNVEIIAACFNISQHLPGRTEESHRRTVRIAFLQARV
jgi:hypothetical protein